MTPSIAPGTRVAACWDKSITGTVKRVCTRHTPKALVAWDMGNSVESELLNTSLAVLPVEPISLPPEAQIKKGQEIRLLGAPAPEAEIDRLKSQISQIEKEGYVPPVGCWLEEYTASSGTSRHVRYNSRAPSFPGKRSGGMVRKSAVGKKDSPQHQQALAAIARRNRISALNRQIKELENGKNL
jgi:hypothetical protein